MMAADDLIRLTNRNRRPWEHGAHHQPAVKPTAIAVYEFCRVANQCLTQLMRP